jgi:hypothetical protein
MHSFHLFFLVGFFFILSGCASQKKTFDYSAFRESNPRSIVILPPLNHSPDVRATYSFYTTVTMPVAEAGYYVFPIALVDQTFKENGLPTPGEMHQASLNKLREVFGADAALYITITQYGSVYSVIDSSVIVSASAELIDLKTGKLLWTGTATASSSEGENKGGGSITGILINAIVKQILGNIGDQGRSIASVTSNRLFSLSENGILPGPRSPDYLTHPRR